MWKTVNVDALYFSRLSPRCGASNHEHAPRRCVLDPTCLSRCKGQSPASRNSSCQEYHKSSRVASEMTVSIAILCPRAHSKVAMRCSYRTTGHACSGLRCPTNQTAVIRGLFMQQPQASSDPPLQSRATLGSLMKIFSNLPTPTPKAQQRQRFAPARSWACWALHKLCLVGV